MAHKKGQGSTKNGRDSQSKRLGVKLFGGQAAISGNIIIRQRGTKYHPGTGVGLGKDHTIYATTDGVVTFTTKKNNKKVVSVVPIGEEIKAAPVKASDSKTKTAKVVDAPKAEKAPKAAAAPKAEKKETPKEEKATKKETAPKAETKKAAPKKAKADDFKKIEGIGPKIAETIAAAGITTFAELAKTSADKIAEIISGVRGNHVPDTWSKQAGMAAEGKWDELKKWQDELDGGKK